jgi:hypothetical protein
MLPTAPIPVPTNLDTSQDSTPFITVSAAISKTLHHGEVLLRNPVDRQFVAVDGSATPTATWLQDPKILNEASLQRVRETIERLVREGKSPTRGRIVPGLSFAFWRTLFDKEVPPALHRAFPAGSGDRAEIARLMSNLVPFRNKLAHHEMSRRPIASHYYEMLTLAGLIDPSARAWIENLAS